MAGACLAVATLFGSPAHARELATAVLVTLEGADGQTITVDIEDSSIFDVPVTATVADLPGPDGHISFGEAMVASNNTPGRQTVAFAIPKSEWTYSPALYPGRAVIHGWVPNMSANDEVTIDGTSQTAFTGDTNPSGWEVQLLSEFYVEADGCEITGLHLSAIWVDGSYCTVRNNTKVGIRLYGGTGGLNSSGNLVKDNTEGGFVFIDQSSDNVVVGNTLDQVRVIGYVDGGFPAVNNRIGGPTPSERNVIVGRGTWNGEGIPGGYALQIFDAIGTMVQNNQIGTSPDGMSVGHTASIAGIALDGKSRNTTIRDNRIAGVLAWAFPPHAPSYRVGAAIRIGGSGDGVRIVGNKIGLNALDQPLLGSITGIETLHWWNPSGVRNVVIGGPGPAEGNEIAGHLGSGISVANTFSGVRVTRNSIYENGGMGIDLVTPAFEYGVTANDPLDADVGANALQNFPEIVFATNNTRVVRAVGRLDSEPSKAYTLEFYASPRGDSSGFGEGRMFLGSGVVATDVAGRATFDVSFTSKVPDGWVIASTATLEPTGDTSEFSAWLPITPIKRARNYGGGWGDARPGQGGTPLPGVGERGHGKGDL